MNEIVESKKCDRNSIYLVDPRVLWEFRFFGESQTLKENPKCAVKIILNDESEETPND